MVRFEADKEANEIFGDSVIGQKTGSHLLADKKQHIFHSIASLLTSPIGNRTGNLAVNMQDTKKGSDYSLMPRQDLHNHLSHIQQQQQQMLINKNLFSVTSKIPENTNIKGNMSAIKSFLSQSAYTNPMYLHFPYTNQDLVNSYGKDDNFDMALFKAGEVSFF